MMRILILANSDLGLYNFRKELIQSLINSGNEVLISLPYGEKVDFLKEMGCTFIETSIDRRGINPFTDFLLLINYLKLINRYTPDKVITYTIKPNVYGGMISRLKKIPVYINITGLGTVFQKNSIVTKLVIAMYKFATKNAKKVFFENIENLNIFTDKKIIAKSKACLLNGAGVNLLDYCFENYPTQNSPISFLFIGRVMKEKGVNELLEVAERFKTEKINAQIDIVGDFEEDIYHFLTKTEPDSPIHYHGYQTNVKPFIKRTHCFVLPSYHEGMANTLLECGAMGRPLITSNIHGCKEAVIDTKNGFLCEPQNANDLYQKMIKFINLPYENKIEMGKCSREHIAKNFNKIDVVDKTVKEIFN